MSTTKIVTDLARYDRISVDGRTIQVAKVTFQPRSGLWQLWAWTIGRPTTITRPFVAGRYPADATFEVE